MNAKIIIAITIASMAIFGYIHFQDPKDPIKSIRDKTIEAQRNEETATKNRMEAEDKLSKAIYDSCYSESLASTGITFTQKQRKAYDCWKQNTTNINSGTVASAISEVPPKGIKSISQTSPSEQKKSNDVQSVERKSSNPKVSKEQTVSSITQNAKSNYWKAYETAISQIHKWEGLRLNAYSDISQCSIGYGFFWSKIPKDKKCKGSITKKKADDQLTERVKSDLAIVQSHFPRLSPVAQGALVSFRHNCPAGYSSIVKNGLSYHSRWCKIAGGSRLKGLVNRRAEESRLIFSK